MLELFSSIYCFLFNLLWSFPPLLFFPRRRLKFLHGQIFHIALCDFCIYVILRKIFCIPDIEKTFIRILFCCTLIGLSTHILAMYIKTYIHMCINVGFPPWKEPAFLIQMSKDFTFLYHLQSVLMKGGVRWGIQLYSSTWTADSIPVIE